MPLYASSGVSSPVPRLLNVHRALVLAIIIVLAVSMVRVLFDSQMSFRVSGVITSVPIGIYWDASCTTPVDSIDWGNLTVGGAETLTIYVENWGNESVFLTVQALNWQAGNTSNVASFSSEEPKIGPGQAAKIDPTLTIFPNASDVSSFSFDIAFGEIFVRLGDFDTLFSSNTNVSLIYPSTSSSSKPLGCTAAMVSDWLASAFVSTKLSNYTEGVDTQGTFVNQTSGDPVGDSGIGIISFGGPNVNPVVKYAESNSTPSADRAPIRFNNQSGVVSFQYSNRTAIPGASMPASALNGGQDFFVIETFMDGTGRYQMLCYGFGWEGTYAAGKYFDAVIYPNLASQSESWIIVRWNDTNGNGFVNGPYDGDTYTIIAQGN
jgi:hypothetical protein